MATKKVAKKAAKKAPAAKKATAKKVVKKAVKKAPAKKVAKKVAKKAPVKKVAKKVAKKAPAKRASATKIVVPPVPVSSARQSTKVVESKPAVSAPVSAPAKPAAPSKKQGSSNRIVLAVVIGILALGAIVLSRGSSSTSNETSMPTESVSPSASASASESESPMATESESPAANVGTTAAPLGIVAKYTATGATIFWNATTATDGLKGYSIEFSSNGGSFNEVATVGVDVFKYDITKSDTAGWTSFKISAVYNDGQKAEGKVFGLPGQYK